MCLVMFELQTEAWKTQQSTIWSMPALSIISYLSYLLHSCTLPDESCLSHSMCLYQVMMTLKFLNDVIDVANDAESTQKSKSMS